ncbi:MAG: hypothetical protein AAF682_04885 [Planctomycetota bacterium]
MPPPSAGPVGGGTAGPASGGPPPTTIRGPTAKSVLRLDWDYPVYTAPAQKTDRSSAKAARQALSREKAFAFIAGDDPRPLLVLRECKVCNGTDDALLKGGIENEKTFLLSTWFHCVKVPVDVMEEDHPFHNLFTQDKTEHLFVASADGSNHDPLESQTSRTELWKSMLSLLGEEYKKKPDASLKKMAKLLDKMDAADSKWNDLAARRDDIREEDGPKSRKLPKIEKELTKLEGERQELRADLAKASALELKKRREAAAAKEQAGV